MDVSVARRNFLRGQFKEGSLTVMHPPGAQPTFADLCDRCGACARACPASIIRLEEQSLPQIDFTKGACDFCGDCAAACPTGALLKDDIANWPWRAEITGACLSMKGTTCRACEDACEARAIRFTLLPQGRAVPVLDESQCSGCGECAFTCPTQAVRFTRPAPAERERTI